MTTCIKSLTLIFLSLNFHSFGQKVQSADLVYYDSGSSKGKTYNEYYSFSESNVKHFIIKHSGKRHAKKKLKTAPEFVEAAAYLDSLLSVDYYTISLDSVEMHALVRDSVYQKTWKISTSDMLECFDSLNRIRFETKFFNRQFELPKSRKSLPGMRSSEDPQTLEVVGGYYFRLDFSLDQKTKFAYSGQSYAPPKPSAYREWFSVFLMQEKFNLFEKSKGMESGFQKNMLQPMIILYVVWKKYGNDL